MNGIERSLGRCKHIFTIAALAMTSTFMVVNPSLAAPPAPPPSSRTTPQNDGAALRTFLRLLLQFATPPRVLNSMEGFANALDKKPLSKQDIADKQAIFKDLYKKSTLDKAQKAMAPYLDDNSLNKREFFLAAINLGKMLDEEPNALYLEQSAAILKRNNIKDPDGSGAKALVRIAQRTITEGRGPN